MSSSTFGGEYSSCYYSVLHSYKLAVVCLVNTVNATCLLNDRHNCKNLLIWTFPFIAIYSGIGLFGLKCATISALPCVQWWYL